MQMLLEGLEPRADKIRFKLSGLLRAAVGRTDYEDRRSRDTS